MIRPPLQLDTVTLVIDPALPPGSVPNDAFEIITEDGRIIRSGTLARVSGSILCPTSLTPVGRFTMTPRQTFTLA